METGILEWYEEQAKSEFPLSRPTKYSRLFIDASFMQFDGFIPVLERVDIQETYMAFYLLTDAGEVVYTIPDSKFDDRQVIKTLYASNGRYLGNITHGDGLGQLYRDGIQVITFNTPFSAMTVTSVNSDAGLYSLDGVYGDIKFMTYLPGSDMLDQSIRIDLSSSGPYGPAWVWNAISVIRDRESIPVLKTLNGVRPTNFNVNIATNDVLKVERSDAELTLSVVTPLNDPISPILKFGA